MPSHYMPPSPFLLVLIPPTATTANACTMHAAPTAACPSPLLLLAFASMSRLLCVSRSLHPPTHLPHTCPCGATWRLDFPLQWPPASWYAPPHLLSRLRAASLCQDNYRPVLRTAFHAIGTMVGFNFHHHTHTPTPRAGAGRDHRLPSAWPACNRQNSSHLQWQAKPTLRLHFLPALKLPGACLLGGRISMILPQCILAT